MGISMWKMAGRSHATFIGWPDSILPCYILFIVADLPSMEGIESVLPRFPLLFLVHCILLIV